MNTGILFPQLILLSLFIATNHAQIPSSSTSPIEMVVSAHPDATAAGERILAAGGTAVDAMIAVQTVLGLVEPQSSGIAGGAFVVYYDAANDKLTSFDAREKAPSGATDERFLDSEGAPLGFVDAWQSGLSVGVPGVPRMMEELHGMYGKVEWEELFTDAKTIAMEGFPVTQRMVGGARLLLSFNPSCEERLFFRDPVTFHYFLNEDCTPKQVGTILTNPDYAETMELLATKGAEAFYTGDMAADIVAKVAADRNPTGNPTITAEDLRDYEMIEREPVCYLYKDTHNICGMGPPSSGALAVGQIFGVLDQFDLTNYELQDVETVHLFTQATRLAFADRNLYVGDSDFITVPVEGMLDPAYLVERATIINMTADLGTATPGVPPGVFDPAAPQPTDTESGTSHVSIIDQYGNALSMTTTIESFFGSGLMVRGFLLNNQITDFSFVHTSDDGIPIANRVQSSKRPRSSMSPTIVLEDGVVKFVTGSPGGSRIIGYTAQSLLSMIDFGLDAQTAVGVPHFQNRNGPTELEDNKPNVTTMEYDFEALALGLTELNHEVVPTGGETSGLSAIQVVEGDDGELLYVGGADPRRDGTARGRVSLSLPESMACRLDVVLGFAVVGLSLLL